MDDKKLENLSNAPLHTPLTAVLATIALELRNIRRTLDEQLAHEVRNIRREFVSMFNQK